MREPVGIVIGVFRGGCEVVYQDRLHDLRLIGRHAHRDLSLAVGDEISFDPAKGVVERRLPRRTQLARQRSRDGREQVIAANMDRLGVVASFAEPPFRAGAVDRFLLAAHAGGLEAILIVNKRDLLEDAPLPEEVRIYSDILPVFSVSARTGTGLGELRAELAGSRTVLAGHSGVGKSSLLNALEPELRLETGAVTRHEKKGSHTTARVTWLRLPDDAIIVDTPGLREIASGPVDPSLLENVYPDVVALAADCQFRDCRHDREPDCAVRTAVEARELSERRVANYRKLLAELLRSGSASTR